MHPEGSTPLLSVRGLRTEFSGGEGRVVAVRDVDMNVAPGERAGIVGESGSGKSALALSILQLIRPPGRITAGQVFLAGQDIAAYSERQMSGIRGRRISLIFQDPMTSLDPVMTIGGQIIEAIRRHQPGINRAAARARATDLLASVEVPNAARRLDDYPHQYSGGMRQRVMIAIALANDPDLLIADEPTTALDVTTQAQVLDLLLRLVSERGTAVLLITHNLGVVAEFCDTVRVMYAGRIVEQGTTAQIFNAPGHPYTQALLASVPYPGRMQRGQPLPSIPGMPPNLAHLPPGCPFEPRCPLGHGRPECIDLRPPQVPLPGGHGRFAECHFAGESQAHKVSEG